jgi:hypothetical protein
MAEDIVLCSHHASINVARQGYHFIDSTNKLVLLAEGKHVFFQTIL